jgi:hypothetical protein
VLAALVAPATAARADGDLAYLPPRTLGMAGAARGNATGTTALALNPSGMSIARSYVIETSYQYAKRLKGHVGTVAIADSTSGFNIGGGLYYTYATGAAGEPPVDLGRHEGGVALSFPLGDRLSVGGTVRYLRVRRDGMGDVPPEKINGFTFDAGLTLRPVSMISIGVAGRGLRELDTYQAPRSFGGGVALVPVPDLSLTFDVASESVADVDYLVTVGGAEYTFASRFSLRGGGGREHGAYGAESFGSAGVSVISEVGAMDVGGRLGFSGKSSTLYLGFAGRLFIPTP